MSGSEARASGLGLVLRKIQVWWRRLLNSVSVWEAETGGAPHREAILTSQISGGGEKVSCG